MRYLMRSLLVGAVAVLFVSVGVSFAYTVVEETTVEPIYADQSHYSTQPQRTVVVEETVIGAVIPKKSHKHFVKFDVEKEDEKCIPKTSFTKRAIAVVAVACGFGLIVGGAVMGSNNRRATTGGLTIGRLTIGEDEVLSTYMHKPPKRTPIGYRVIKRTTVIH